MSNLKVGHNTKKMAGAKKITRSLMANTDNFHLRVKIVKGGKEIYNERANSLLGSFSAILGSYFGRPRHRDFDLPYMTNQAYLPNPYSRIMAVKGNHTTHSTSQLHPHSHGIVSWPSSNVVRISHATGTEASALRESAVYIVITNPDNAGTYKVLSHDVVSTSQTDFTLEGLVSDPGDDITGYVFIVAAYNPLQFGEAAILSQTGRRNRIYLGKSSTPTKLDDVWVKDPHALSDFSGYNTSITAPVIAVNQSRIALSALFTNVSGEERNVSEVGLTCYLPSGQSGNNPSFTGSRALNPPDFLEGNMGDSRYYSMIARDVVTSFPVAPSESFTVIYEIVTSVNQALTSGVVAGFNEILYRQLAQADRVTRTYWNVDHETDATRWAFRITDLTARNTYDNIFGPILGKEQTEVDIDDYFLRNITNGHSRIPHGEENDSLFYHPPTIAGAVQEENEAYTIIERIVENRGSVNVVAKQIGLVVSSGNQSDRPVLISHDILDEPDWITFEPGDIYRIRYKIGVEISGGS